MLGFSSSWDTSTVSLTVVASRVSTALFTAVVSLGRGQADDDGRCALDRRTGTGARPHDPTAPTRGTHATASAAGPGSERLTGRVLGRDGGIRTHDLPLPKRTRYQAAPHPVTPRSLVGLADE